jgi:hypothetical protein
MKFRVTHVEGSKKGLTESFDLPVVTVGRDPSNALQFDPLKDDRVSTRHAQLLEQAGGVMLMDLGSRNGTYLNGQRIQGSATVASGALIQFGEAGPMVVIQFDAPPAPGRTTPAMPVAAPPAEKKGTKGCLVVGIIVLLLLVFGGVGGAFFMLSKKPASDENPWATVGIGSSYETTIETHMEKPVKMDTTSSMKQTLVSRTELVAKVKTEMKAAGTELPPSEAEVPLKNPVQDKAAEKPLEEKNESVTVKAGTFDCHYTKTRATVGGAETTTEVWMARDVPVAVKTKSSSEAMTSTTELTKVDKK